MLKNCKSSFKNGNLVFSSLGEVQYSYLARLQRGVNY